MSYKFVKLLDNRTGLKYPWILKCDSLPILIEHTDKYMRTSIQEGLQDLFDIKLRGKAQHTNTSWSNVVDNLMQIKGTGLIDTSVLLEQQVIEGKMKTMNLYGIIYLRENGSYMPHASTFEVLDEIIMSDMVYPNYTKDDIKIKQWPNGTHYYAHIGNMQVEDKLGNVKWDSRKEAEKEALIYLNKNL